MILKTFPQPCKGAYWHLEYSGPHTLSSLRTSSQSDGLAS